MSYLDSMRPDDHVAYSLFYKLWKLLELTCKVGHIEGLREHWGVELPTCPKQQNGFDCGLYVCKAMRATMLGIPLKVSASSMPGFRRSILEALKRWPDSHPEPTNLDLLQANEVFTSLTIPGTLIATQRKTKGTQQSAEVMDLGEYSLFMFSGTLRLSLPD
jgi:Ulp1 protease family, C-terminal catalytic domain